MASFENAKIGDKVCIHSPAYWLSPPSLKVGEITKITKTQITALGERFNIRNGRMIGYESTYLCNLTPEIEAQFAHENMTFKAERKCRIMAEFISKAKGAEAIRIAALLPAELLEKPPTT